MTAPARTSLIISCLLATAALSHAAVRFVHATPENTCHADGSPLPEDIESIGWKWLPGEGNGGVFASIAGAVHATLMVQLDGLEPGAVYEVFGYIWADGWELDHPKTRAHVPAQFGLGLATLHTFDGPDQPTRGHVMAWEVTPGSSSGRAYGLAAAIEEDESLELQYGESRLIRARLGRLHADSEGRLPVFFSAYPYHRPAGPAWIDGVGVRRVEAEGPLEEGWKKGTWLNLAIRAGDPITIERELRRGVDVNILDEEHLSPLFHAVVAGDESLVKRLLATASDPNRPEQSASPLCAAALASSEAIVKLLMDAGADVPLEVAKDWGTLSKEVHPGFLHPVLCALNAGSVPVLRMLLEKRPDLDIRMLAHMQPIKPEGGNEIRPPGTSFLEEAIQAENWKMAAYLIDEGYADLGDRALDSRLLVSCCVTGEAAMPVMEGLLKLGVKPVDFSSGSRPRSDANGDGREHDALSGWMLPQDALSAAVWTGNMQLVKRFLSEADYAPLDYIERLYMTAVFRQDAAMVALIENHFRRIRPQRWKPADESAPTATMRDEDPRVFLPRTTPPPARSGRTQGQYVLGVIASPEAMDPAVALSATASTRQGWKVVDRDLVESAMLETRIGKPWLDGKHHLAPFGDKLNADVLAIIDAIKGDSESVYSIEMVEVATGLVVHREHLSGKAFKPEEDLPALLERSARALDAASRNERRQAVTLLSFSARGGLPNEMALASLLHATVQHQVDSTSGFISLTRSQSARLVEEQAMQGKNTLWGAAHLVEGSVSPSGQPGTIRVALRLETLGADRTSTTIDVEAVGSIQDPAAVMTTAWKNLLAAAIGTLEGAGPKVADSPSAAIASEEAKRLLREADWLMSGKMDPNRALSLIESASALGAPHGDLIRVHLDHLFRRVESLSCRRIGHPETAQPIHMAFSHLRELPVAFDLADRMAYELPLARELLHHASFYFTRHRGNLPHPRSRRDHHGNEFWLTINALSFMRAAIYEDLLTPEQREDYEMLGRELNVFTKEYYAALAEVTHHDSGRSALLSNGHRWIYKRNPELSRGILGSIHQVNNIWRFFPARSIDKHHGLAQFASDIHRALEKDHSPKAELFKADIQCYLATDGEAPAAVRDFVAAAMNANRDDWYELGFSTHTAESMVRRHTPSLWFGECWNGGSMLPTLVHAPRPAPEALRKATIYLNMHHYRSGLPRPIETRWYQIGSSENWYDKAMRAALIRKDATRLRELLDGIRLHLMYSGHNHVTLLDKRYRNALRQLARPESAGKTVTASPFADFRSSTSSQAGAANWFLRDQENPDLLWIFYFASTGRTLGVSDSGAATTYADTPETRFRDAWLLGIDCRTGEIKLNANIHKEALVAFGCGVPHIASGPWEMSLDQNRNSIMINMRVFHDRELTRHSHHEIIVIDKATGKVRTLPERLQIARFTERQTHACWVNVVGLGDEFFFIDESGFKDATRRNAASEDSNSVSIYRLGSDMKLSPLVEHGRRPALSPFDSLNNIPTEIAVDGDRLLVYNARSHAHFNPAGGSWEMVEDHHTRFGFKMYHFAQRELQRSIGSVHQILDGGKETGWKIDFNKLYPDRFWCVNDVLGAAELSVKLDIPKDFRDGTTMVVREYEPVGDGSKSKRSVQKDKPFDDYISDHPFHLVVLNQSEDSLIVGLQAGSKLKWKRPSREGLHLPFLWKISKKEVLSLLGENPAGESPE